jgi:DNA-directed RNA polymerase II subunit RPB1
MEIIYSDNAADQKVIRIRPYLPQGETDTEIIAVLRELAEDLLQNFTLRGFQEIPKISTTKDVMECVRAYFDDKGEVVKDKENWVIETDGVALQKVMTVEGVDHTRTLSNSIVEIL